MEKAKKASFSFKGFTVPKFSYNKPTKGNEDVGLYFDVRGEFNEDEREFLLYLELIGKEDGSEGKNVISINSIGRFKFSDDCTLTTIPDYFYTNSIAIMYPYIRAFVSNLTLQANNKVMVLDTLNLTSLKDILKENTELI